MRTILIGLVLSLFAWTASAQTLVLVNDVSQSMTSDSLDTQFQAYATLLAGPLYHQLSGQRVVVIVFGSSAATVSNGSVEDAVAAFTSLANPVTRNEVINAAYGWTPPSSEGGPGRSVTGPRDSTCVASMLTLVHKLAADLPAPIIVDISGDGEDNCSTNAREKSQAMWDDGIVINSLPMGSDDVAAWYEANVTTGFQIPAAGVNDFEVALFEKLMAEVAMLGPQKN